MTPNCRCFQKWDLYKNLDPNFFQRGSRTPRLPQIPVPLLHTAPAPSPTPAQLLLLYADRRVTLGHVRSAGYAKHNFCEVERSLLLTSVVILPLVRTYISDLLPEPVWIFINPGAHNGPLTSKLFLLSDSAPYLLLNIHTYAFHFGDRFQTLYFLFPLGLVLIFISNR